jgi:hypothetical protein
MLCYYKAERRAIDVDEGGKRQKIDQLGSFGDEDAAARLFIIGMSDNGLSFSSGN